MDHRCYEELLNERKNMELTYEERIAHLQDQHAEVSIYPIILGYSTGPPTRNPC